jgi:hypothetical protein
MNKEKLLQMTSKEIEKFLNTSISSIAFESENSVAIKEKMIDMIKPLFDDSVEISNPYYDNREIGIILYDLYISFKVSTKKTEKTTQVTKLRKKYIRTIGTFKFNDIKLSFYNPNFDGLDLDNYIVKVSKNFCTGGASISLKHRKEKMIRKKVILNAAQPKIKKEYFNPGFNQEKWDYILLKTEEKNKELIDGEIEKMFKFDID